MTKVNFISAKAMYRFLADKETDLYNTEHGLYLFKYSESGDICQYALDKTRAQEICESARQQDEPSWSSQLGPGGQVMDKKQAEKQLASIYYLPGWVIADSKTFN